MKEASQLHHFLLVHGAGHGAWCWYKMKALLQKEGHRVTCLDLAGAGIDPANADQILTFDQYHRPLRHFLQALPDDDKVILVGHSAGGLSVTRASQEFGSKIRLAIYVAATMLEFGFQSPKDIEDGVPDLSVYGDVYEFGFGFGPHKPPTSAILRKQFQPSILYQLSPIEDVALGSLLLRPCPTTALESARFDSVGKGVEKVHRVYVKTTCDRMVKLAQQEEMIRRWPPHEVFTVESDHSPFFSNPRQLFQILIKATANLAMAASDPLKG